MTDQEYLTYLKTKNFEELEDIVENFNKSQNWKRFEVLKEFIEGKRREEPELYREHERIMRYKTIGPRIGAAIIDSIISGLANWLGSVLPRSFDFENEITSLILTLLSHALWGIIILYPMVQYGATLGMQFARIKLYDRSEADSNKTQRLIRETVFVLPLLILSLFPQLIFLSWVIALFYIQLILIALANPIVIYFDSKHRGINDLISKTVILRVRNNI